MTTSLNQLRAWWDARTRREHIMLGAMAALLAAVLLWYGLVSPVSAWRENARDRREQAAANLVSVEGDVARLNAEAVVRPASSGEPIEPLLARTAQAAGVVIDRQQAEPDGAQTIWLTAVQSPALFGWIATLEQTHGVSATVVTVLKSPSGAGLDVQASFRSVGS